MNPTPRFRIYRHLICDLCFEHNIRLVKNYAGFIAICEPCLKMEEKERADQLAASATMMNLRKNVLPLSHCYTLSEKILLPPPTIDFDAASRAWRANKKKVKNGDGSFVYI
jgi:hypothetical protein